MKKSYTIVLGVIGVDAHVVGNKIMHFALEQEGFRVVNIGTFVSQDDFIKAAIETAADAICAASLCGHGELDLIGFRSHCVEAGISDILLVAGGNLVVGKQDWEEVRQRFEKMGFDRVYPPGVSPRVVMEDIKRDLDSRKG